MGFFDDHIIGDDPSDFRHSKRPSLKYLLKSHDELMEEALDDLETQLEEEDASTVEDAFRERERP